MNKDNNVNYNTKQSDVKAFSDFVPDEEKKSLEDTKRNYLKNDGGKYNLPNKTRLRFNKVTKTWQDVSKKEVKDKIKALENIKIKSFDEVINENEYAFGNTQYNWEKFLTDLKKEIHTQKGNLMQVSNSPSNNATVSNILKEIDLHFNDILSLIENRHSEYIKKPNMLNPYPYDGK